MKSGLQLPGAEKEQLKLGYMRLSDAAPLIVAKEQGLYEKYGLDVSLQREVSWANVRDKVAIGHLDAAQMLAPMPIISTLGGAGMRVPMLTGMILSLNGNAITLSQTLMDKILEGEDALDTRARSQRLASIVKSRAEGGLFTFATVHTFSMHSILLRRWLQAGGLDPDRDVRLIVLPPEQMVDSLANGVIDGYCVGEPWNSISVQYGVGAVVATGYEIWNNAPEKVLGVTAAWHQNHPGTHLRLRLALMEACQWLANMDSRDECTDILARPEYLDLSERILRPSLTGKFSSQRLLEPENIPDFHVFWRYQAAFPWRSYAAILISECAPMLGSRITREKSIALAQSTYRTDLYREAARLLEVPAPSKDWKDEGTHSLPWTMDQDLSMGPDSLIWDPA